MTSLYVVTDASGFTLATHATHDALQREAVRLNLSLPVRVWHWQQVRKGKVHFTWQTPAEWSLHEQFEWA